MNAPDLAQQIYSCRVAKESKKLSHHVLSTTDWDHEKQFVMKAIITDKFIQNPQLQEKLLLTGAKTLIEATTDPFWGARVIMGSKLLAKGKWKGSNHLGVILGEIREDLKRSEAWLNFQLPQSDDEPSISTDSTNTESLSADLEVVNELHGNDSMLSNPRLSSVTIRRGNAGSKKRSEKQKKKTW